MKKHFKSLIALFLMAIATILIVPKTFAIKSDATGTVNISGIKEDNTNVAIYKIIDVNIDDNVEQPKQPVYTWVKSVGEWLCGTVDSEGKCTGTYKDYVKRTGTGTEQDPYVYEVTDTFNDSLSDTTGIAGFYEALKDAITGTNPSITGLSTIYNGTTNAGSLEVKNVAMGGYLAIITGTNYTYRPTVVNVYPKSNNGSWAVTGGNAVAKSTSPQIVKKVENADAATAGIGTVLDFSIDVDVPNYIEGLKSKDITITDTFSDGLTFNVNSLEVYGVLGNLYDSEGKVITANLKTINATVGTTINDYTLKSTSVGGFTITINLDEYKNLIAKGYSKLYIKYTGTVNSEAVVHNAETNTATLVYSTDPSKEDVTKKDEVKVYTYGINITKIDKKKTEDGKTIYLPNAVFNIADENGLTLQFICISGSHYRLATYTIDENEKITWESGSTPDVKTDDDGTLVIDGLDVGEYTVTETKAPEGYVKLNGSFTIKIQDDAVDGDVDVKPLAANKGYVTETVENTTGFELPVTGGIGTLLFSVLGIVFMGVAVSLVRNILKNKKVQSNI